MGLFSRIFGGGGKTPEERPSQPFMAAAGDAGVLIQNSDQLEKYLTGQGGNGVATNGDVNKAMQLSAVQACVRLIAGGISNTPRKVMETTGPSTQEEIMKGELHRLVTRRPNRWQRPAQFFRMGTSHVMLRGNFYCLKVMGANNKPLELMPLDPSRVQVEKLESGQIVYRYSREKDGRRIEFNKDQIFHLYLNTLDGVNGVTPISYARMTMDSGYAMDSYGKAVFENGARVPGVLMTDRRLGPEGRDNVRSAISEHRAGRTQEGSELILEDGLKYERISMTASDAQYIEARQATKADIYELYGIPRHMTALAQTQSNWGTGVDAHNKQFIQWVLEDYYVMWEEAFNVDVIPDASAQRVTFDRAKLTRGDLEARTAFYTAMMQWGAMSPNEVRDELERNPREGGDIYYPPPNMTQEDESDDDDGSTGEGTTQETDE